MWTEHNSRSRPLQTSPIHSTQYTPVESIHDHSEAQARACVRSLSCGIAQAVEPGVYVVSVSNSDGQLKVPTIQALSKTIMHGPSNTDTQIEAPPSSFDPSRTTIAHWASVEVSDCCRGGLVGHRLS